MQCVQCDHKLPKVGLFCSFCGQEIEKSNFEKKNLPKPKKKKRSNDELMKISLDSLAVLKSRIRNHAVNRNWTMLGCILLYTLSLTVVIIFADLKYIFDHAILLAPYLVFIVFLKSPTRSITRKEYYTIAHSSNEHGAHRCIFCGNRGIYIRGQYKSDVKHSQCSRCGKTLFKH